MYHTEGVSGERLLSGHSTFSLQLMVERHEQSKVCMQRKPSGTARKSWNRFEHTNLHPDLKQKRLFQSSVQVKKNTLLVLDGLWKAEGLMSQEPPLH